MIGDGGHEMQIFKKSEDDTHGLIPYSLGVTAIVVTITAIAGANVLSQVAQTGNGPAYARSAPKTPPAAVAANAQKKPAAGIDYDATASIDGGRMTNFLRQPIILDPCTGREK